MIREALKSIRNGKMVLIYDSDDREGETDLVIPAEATEPKDVACLRRDGGGLICVAIHPDAAEKLGLPFMSDILRNVNGEFSFVKSIVEKKGDIPYDEKSSFSLWVNHRETFTGITDIDRSITIKNLGKAVKMVMNGGSFDLGSEFRSPGHVPVLRAAKNLTEERRGQTELSIALALMAEITPAMVICEMLDEKSGKALSKEDARKYASERGLVFLEGKEISEAYRSWSV
ncbi:MAG: 3,4-dihydroxy-2-butanone-4-phosphate synthase [Candidatus Syntropharchaeia archaeon]